MHPYQSIGRFRAHSFETCLCQEMDSRQMMRKIRTLAVELHAHDCAKLALAPGIPAKIHSQLQQAQALNRICSDPGLPLKRLLQDGRQLQTCAQQALQEGGLNLPAQGKAPRILALIAALSCDGSRSFTEEMLIQDIAAFDDIQPLNMPELWAVPEALRITLAHRSVAVIQAILANAHQRCVAEKWIQSPRGSLFKKSPAFFERALYLTGEQECSEPRCILDQFLNQQGISPEQMIRKAHEEQAAELLLLDRLLAAKRLVDHMDWNRAFERLSRVDQELRYDPAQIYPQMDDDSRSALRHQLSKVAFQLKISEMTLARQAIQAALEAARNEKSPQDTICYWLMTDEGLKKLAHRMNVSDRPLSKIVPDPTGQKLSMGLACLTVLLWALWILWMDHPLLYLPGLPIAWTSANCIIGRIFPRYFAPAKLLRMAVKSVPDAWRTLVVMPVLLTSADRAREICAQMEALGCLESDRNIRYLILGDFSDHGQSHAPDDKAIVDAARSAVKAMNQRAGWEKYGYIHRPRSYLKVDRRWMGFDRKRGALMALNRLLLNLPGASDAFAVEDQACVWLRQGFRFVVTLDADTRFLPDAIPALIGCMAHPLNHHSNDHRGYGIIQPAMEMMPSACTNAFVHLFAGSGGINTYPATLSNLYQDITGAGIFAGKGIYDVKPFYEALEGVLPEGRILSHDLIEGAIVRTGFAGDIAFYDSYPTTLAAVMKRFNRWTRGDWQLLPFICALKPLSKGKRLCLIHRIQMLGNLLRSLQGPCLMLTLLIAVWAGSANALAAAMLAIYLNPLLELGNRDRLKWRRATAEFSMLPITSWQALDAILRTLWRLAISGKHMLDWVPAADAERTKMSTALPGRLAVILLLPVLLVGGWASAAIALAALFGISPGWIGDMENSSEDSDKGLHSNEIALLNDLARDTWHFFEKYVPLGSSGLPPDNVQMDPPTGTAHRTSPTNIGLYLASCLAAHRMGFIPVEQLYLRLCDTLKSLSQMEKWHGHLYNWYDTRDLSVLRPRYISSVDSGNFAACLLFTARGLQQLPGVHSDLNALALQMTDMALNMDFTRLYGQDRKLFFIGADGENHRLSSAHYDLLASESRILSFVALMLRQVDLKHWSKLSRTAVRIGDNMALASWSGTMFEYLMPELFMPAPERSLLGQSHRSIIQAQRALGKRMKRPWGVSESGYAAFDMHLNYQYRAFGLRSLALCGSTLENVVAPYASVLALSIQPGAVAENIADMKNMNWMDEYGLYEAVDYMHLTPSGAPVPVKSHMAHHQGMILCALCNALCNQYVANTFMSIPQAQALNLLIQEKPIPTVRLKPLPVPDALTPHLSARTAMARSPQPSHRHTDGHLLYGGEATVYIQSDGNMHYVKHGICAGRTPGRLMAQTDGAYLHISDDTTAITLGESAAMRYEPGSISFRTALSQVDICARFSLSPEDGSFCKDLTFTNAGEKNCTLQVVDVFPIGLAPEADLRAHAIFRNLFVESQKLTDQAVIFKRRPRDPQETSPMWVHMTSESNPVFETDYESLTGRTGNTAIPASLTFPEKSRFGTVLNPVSAIRLIITLAPGESRRIYFAMNLIDSDADPLRWLHQYLSADAIDRTHQLSTACARAMLEFSGLEPAQHALLQRMAALLMDGRLAAWAREDHTPQNGMPRQRLWALGLSGDRPLMVMWLKDVQQDDVLKDLIRSHGFYRSMGLEIDLALVNDFGNSYHQPVRDLISERIQSSHLHHRQCMPGGVWVLDGQALNPEMRRLLSRAAAVQFQGSKNLFDQIRFLLKPLDLPLPHRIRQIPTGLSHLPDLNRQFYNGYGGFDEFGRYVIDISPRHLPPAPWCNLLTNDQGGILLSDRGGSFLFHGNSRSDRLTPFYNDTLREGWGIMVYLVQDETGDVLNLLPGAVPAMPFRVTFDGSHAEYRFDLDHLSGSIKFCMAADKAELRMAVHLQNHALSEGHYTILTLVQWQMGVDAQDDVFLITWNDGSACYASGATEGVGYLAAQNPHATPEPGMIPLIGQGHILSPQGLAAPADASGWSLGVPVLLNCESNVILNFAIGWAESPSEAREQVRRFYGDPVDPFARAHDQWDNIRNGLRIHTPDPAINFMANGFLLHQTLSARIQGRTGLYQPGGAYGFRDQLQDMLALLPSDPNRVRRHILRCAAHQFEDGDVMHWWHEPYLGVRTKISDDKLFLPWVTAAYIQYTEDTAILRESIPYLKNVPIPEGCEDIFAEMQPGDIAASLHDHCMRAFRHADRRGIHGLALMGSGDWNDGMNRIGIHGQGESVWLSEFIVACARAYCAVIQSEDDRAYLEHLANALTSAIESQGWDGQWYLRAYTDQGMKLGSAEGQVCRIDAISQAWAVLCGLNSERCHTAMNSAWEMLVDPDLGIVKLLTPPFEGDAIDPGYICGYPPGVRENGAQYTHGACWLLMALIRLGWADKAHAVLKMMMPPYHADSPAKADRYRVEPYVMAADIYSTPSHEGRGGWTWYTGAAAWMYQCILEMLGYERKGQNVRLNALLNDWPEVSVEISVGNASYQLICRPDVECITLDNRTIDGAFIPLIDDGQKHQALFPPRKAEPCDLKSTNIPFLHLTVSQ